jgi:hypothetical protein
MRLWKTAHFMLLQYLFVRQKEFFAYFLDYSRTDSWQPLKSDRQTAGQSKLARIASPVSSDREKAV